jgi:CheY-like chemotaxis protein
MTEPVRQPYVLVADDDREFREELIPKALGELRARVLQAANVAEACFLAAKHGAGSDDPVELVVLDMHMPLHENCLDVARDGGIRTLQFFGRCTAPVVVFTAYPSFRNCVAAVRAGASAYLPKKSQSVYKEEPEGGRDDLVETCRRLLEGRPAEPPPPRTLPEPDWMQENYEWLCGQFAEKWVAFIEPDKARAAEIEVVDRGAYGVVARDQEDALRRLLVEKAAYLGYLPEALWVPEIPSYH